MKLLEALHNEVPNLIVKYGNKTLHCEEQFFVVSNPYTRQDYYYGIDEDDAVAWLLDESGKS